MELVLTKVVVSSLFSAFVGVLKILASPMTLRMIELWSMGSFVSARWEDVLQAMLFVITV